MNAWLSLGLGFLLGFLPLWMYISTLPSSEQIVTLTVPPVKDTHVTESARVNSCPSDVVASNGFTVHDFPCPPAKLVGADHHRTKLLGVLMDHHSFLLLGDLMSQAKTYVEWGTGGSTQVAAARVPGRMFSIEHAKPWCDKLLEDPIVNWAISTKQKLLFNCVDHSLPLKRWGKVAPTHVQTLANVYVAAIDTMNIPKPVDLILVDGRFRVACTLYALLHGYVGDSSVLVVDDFWDRPHYHKVLRFFDLASPRCAKATTVFLKKKPSINRGEAIALLKEYMEDQR